MIYTRYSSKLGLDYDGQRREILARFDEVSDVASGTFEMQERPGLKAILDSVGEVEALV